VSKIIREYHTQWGSAIPVDDIVDQGVERGLERDEVVSAIAQLKRKGIVAELDHDTIKFM
jgi:hypothetical protein